MWNAGTGIFEIIFRTFVIYALILIGLRLTGKREVGQMTPFDLALLLLIANAVQNAMTGPDTSLIGGIAAAGTLFTVHALLSRLVWKHRGLRQAVAGNPALLIHRGSVVRRNLDKEHVSLEELRQALREHGIAEFVEVYSATLEVDGSISVLRNDERPAEPRPHHHIRFLQRKEQ